MGALGAAQAGAPQGVQQLLAMGGLDPSQSQLYEFLINSTFATAQANYNLFGKTLGSKEKQKEIFEKYETGRDSLLTSVVKKNTKFPYNPFEKPSSLRKNYAELSSDLETKISLRNKALASKKKEESSSLLGRKVHGDYFDEDTSLGTSYREVNKKLFVNSYSEDKSVEKKRNTDISSK